MKKPLAALIFFAALAPLARAEKTLYSDNAVYVPLELTWSTPTEIKQAAAVFPHPLLAHRAIVTTPDGTLQTEDGGRTWKPWTSAGPGPVSTIAFDPRKSERFLVAANGLWETTDNGATFRQLATTQNGLASDTVTDVIFYSGDPGNNTLLAVHGDAAPGLSRSRDDGKTWEVVNLENFFSRVLGGDSTTFKRIFLFGASTSEPDVMGLFMGTTPGEYVSELKRDALLTDMAFSPASEGDVLFSTSDEGAFRIAGGSSSVGQEIVPMPVPDVPGWSSLSVTWGPNADVLKICAYDPSRAGLVVSSDSFKTFQTINGVLVSSLVKEGAAVRPNANGTIFYAVANGTLSVGRAESVPFVSATPAVLELSQDAPTLRDVREAFTSFAKTSDGRFGVAAEEIAESFGDLEASYRDRQLTINATPQGKPADVTIDLSRAGGEPDAPMFDDGKHNDGAANDGTYGITFVYETKRLNKDWRPAAPGPVPFGVAAVSETGERAGAVTLAGIYTRIASFDMEGKKSKGSLAADSTGEVSVRPTLNPPDIHDGSSCLRIEPRGGPWTVSIKASRQAQDITGYEALSFWVRTETAGEFPTTLNVQLLDRPEFSEPTTTPPLAIVPDLIAQGAIGEEYRFVIVPLEQPSDSSFQPSRLDQIILSGEATSPCVFFLDGIRFHATRTEISTP